MDILNKLGALRKKKTPREIDGVEFGFYPVRMARVLTGDMKEILTPISDAIQVLVHPRGQDEEILEEVMPDGTVARARKPVSPEMAKYRADKKKEALDNAMGVVFCDATRYNLARIVMDSLRDDCPADPSEADVKAFADHPDMSMARFVEFVKGMVLANPSIFGELGNLIRERVTQVMDRVKAQEPEETETPDPSAPTEMADDEAAPPSTKPALTVMTDEEEVPTK